MKKAFLYSIICMCLFVFCDVSGQQYHSHSKRAVKYFQEALSLFHDRKDQEALEFIDKAISADKGFVEAYMMKAQILKDRHDYVSAMKYFRKALSLDPDFYPEGYIVLASVEFSLGKYQEALGNINTFIAKDSFGQISMEDALAFRKRAEFAIECISYPVHFNPVNLGDSINSEYNEYWPSISLDENQLVFTIMLPKKGMDGKNMDELQEDFYYSMKNEDSIWTKRKSVGNTLNTTKNEGAQSISADGRYLFFTACDRSDGYGRCDIFYSVLTDKKWCKPFNAGSAINSSYSDKHPSVSSDGRMLFFASNRPGGYGGMDIWYSVKDEEGDWKQAKNLGEIINTLGNELSPFIHPDNQSLYFSSEGHSNLGGGDIFVSRLDSAGNWGEAINMGYPINTHNNEMGLIVNPQGSTAYYSSDRKEGRGMDIFSFELPKTLRPVYVSYMKGRVYDSNTFKGIQAEFQLIERETGKLVVKSKSNKGEGDFTVPLPTDKNYVLNVSHPGYLFYSGNFEFDKESVDKKPYYVNVPLKKLRSGETIVLKNIYFEFDSHALLPDSEIELEKIFELLRQNALLNIEISGHTDNIGSEEYNIRLSKKRAESVVNYLIERGISGERLHSKGYGTQKALVPNNSEENRAKNRRTELEIL